MLGYIIYFLCMAFMGAVCWFGVKEFGEFRGNSLIAWTLFVVFAAFDAYVAFGFLTEYFSLSKEMLVLFVALSLPLFVGVAYIGRKIMVKYCSCKK